MSLKDKEIEKIRNKLNETVINSLSFWLYDSFRNSFRSNLEHRYVVENFTALAIER